MKKYLLLMLVGFVFLFSCKKDHSKGTNPTGQKYTVNFTVSDVVKATASANKLRVNSAADTFKKYIKNLHYLVYDSGGKLVRQINQDTTSANFGNISDGFSPGTYNIVFVANAASFSAGQFYGSTPIPDYFTGSFLLDGPFYKSMSLTVSTSNINQQITLDRLDAQLHIKATDVIPTDLDSIQFECNAFYGQYAMGTGVFKYTGGTFIFKHVFTAAEKGTSNFQFATICYNTSFAFSVTVTRYGKPYVNSKPLIISNITCVKNKITIMTGALFQPISTGVQNGGFQLSLDPVWNDLVINF